MAKNKESAKKPASNSSKNGKASASTAKPSTKKK